MTTESRSSLNEGLASSLRNMARNAALERFHGNYGYRSEGTVALRWTLVDEIADALDAQDRLLRVALAARDLATSMEIDNEAPLSQQEALHGALDEARADIERARLRND